MTHQVDGQNHTYIFTVKETSANVRYLTISGDRGLKGGGLLIFEEDFKNFKEGLEWILSKALTQ